MSAKRHAIEIRRRVLVENPVIARFMKHAMKTEKLVAQLQREFKEMRNIIRFVKNVDRQTARALSSAMTYQEYKPAVKAKAKRRIKNAHAAPVRLDNVIQFPPQKKSTKAA